MTPVEYIDTLEYNTRVDIEAKRSTRTDVSSLILRANLLESSAKFFREQDSTLPPKQRREDPALLFFGGRSREILAMPREYFKIK